MDKNGSSKETPIIKVGTRVKYKFDNHIWYSGTVMELNRVGKVKTFNQILIKFDDNDISYYSYPSEFIKIIYEEEAQGIEIGKRLSKNESPSEQNGRKTKSCKMNTSQRNAINSDSDSDSLCQPLFDLNNQSSN